MQQCRYQVDMSRLSRLSHAVLSQLISSCHQGSCQHWWGVESNSRPYNMLLLLLFTAPYRLIQTAPRICSSQGSWSPSPPSRV
jgi:hypothetical protein